MSKLSKAQQIRDLEAELRQHRRARTTLMLKIEEERLLRVAAQRGLVPYVHALEQFAKWLRARPVLRRKLEPVLRELGIWEIRLAYDPDKDLKLSAVSPQKYADLHDALRILSEDPHVRHSA